MLEEGVRGAFRSVNISPLVDPGTERFVLPHPEGFLINDGRLDHFAVRKDAPGHSIDMFIFRIYVLVSVTRCV